MDHRDLKNNPRETLLTHWSPNPKHGSPRCGSKSMRVTDGHTPGLAHLPHGGVDCPRCLKHMTAAAAGSAK